MYPSKFTQGGWNRPLRRQPRTGSSWLKALAESIMFYIALIVAMLVVTGSYEFVKAMIHLLTTFFPGQ